MIIMSEFLSIYVSLSMYVCLRISVKVPARFGPRFGSILGPTGFDLGLVQPGSNGFEPASRYRLNGFDLGSRQVQWVRDRIQGTGFKVQVQGIVPRYRVQGTGSRYM